MPQYEPALNLINGLASLTLLLLASLLLIRLLRGTRRGPGIFITLGVLVFALLGSLQFLAANNLLNITLWATPFITIFLGLAVVGLFTALFMEPTDIETLKQRGVVDDLTGLYEKSFLEHYLVHKVKDLEDTQPVLSLLMIDVDDFKPYNDTFGHLAGDTLIRKIAKTLQDEARGDDIVVRFGGDEFVIAARVGPPNAWSMAERIRKSLESKITPSKDPELKKPVTVSIGVATWLEDAQSARQLIEVADQRMYEAKRRGKNQVYAGIRAAIQHPLPQTPPEGEAQPEPAVESEEEIPTPEDIAATIAAESSAPPQSEAQETSEKPSEETPSEEKKSDG
ncbi:MAG: diguanylate cyclase [Chloroflexi bacterium]|nr:diguanylate cyclase [Chloroflexota bacterium]